MARVFVRASSQRIDLGSAPVSAYPFTIAAWARTPNITDFQVILGLSDGAAAAGEDSWLLIFGGSTAGDPIRFASIVGGSASIAATTSGYSADTWHHCCAVGTSATSRTVYIDGGSAGSNTSSSTPVGVNQGAIAARKLDVPSSYMDGDVCEIGIWKVALTAAEVAMLADGFAPPLVRPDALVSYPSLTRDLIDEWGGVALTDVSSAVSNHHIKVIYPTTQRRVFHPAAAAATFDLDRIERRTMRGHMRGILRGT